MTFELQGNNALIVRGISFTDKWFEREAICDIVC